MKRYLISTTTHTFSGRQIAAWEGDYVEADSKEAAVKKGAEWEMHLLRLGGASRVDLDGNVVTYVQDDEQFYMEIHADEEVIA